MSLSKQGLFGHSFLSHHFMYFQPFSVEGEGRAAVLTGYVGNKLTTSMGYTKGKEVRLALESDRCHAGT
jgi:hypothetical protein